MWKVQAHVFYWVSTALQRTSVATKIHIDKHGLNKKSVIGPKFHADMLKQVEPLSDEIGVLGARYTLVSVERLLDALRKGGMTYEDLIDHLDQIDKRLRDELTAATVLVIDEKMKGLFDGVLLFGPEVEHEFPQMSEDIAESGKCLALARPTAAVFHLMRVMEIAVQRLGDKLGITLVSEKVWQKILNDINGAIKTLDQKAPATRLYAEIAAHLYHVKLAWRNEVMHPKQTYTPDEASELFGAVKLFTRELAAIF
jgi:hypothetical protein